MSRFCWHTLLVFVLALQPGCVWKFWGQGSPVEERNFDVYGTVSSLSAERLVVDTKQGQQTFLFGPASVKGSDTFDEGQVVHVLYKKLDEGNVVTLVVKKGN